MLPQEIIATPVNTKQPIITNNDRGVAGAVIGQLGQFQSLEFNAALQKCLQEYPRSIAHRPQEAAAMQLPCLKGILEEDGPKN
jgi:hypothetical protein